MRRSTALLMTQGVCHAHHLHPRIRTVVVRKGLPWNAPEGVWRGFVDPFSRLALIRACTRGRTAILKAKRRPQGEKSEALAVQAPLRRPAGASETEGARSSWGRSPRRPGREGCRVRRRGAPLYLHRLPVREGAKASTVFPRRFSVTAPRRRDPLSGLHPHAEFLTFLCSRRVVQGASARSSRG